MQEYALITGGSQGIGRAFAFELANRGIPVVLVALPTPELAQTKEDLLAKYPNHLVHTIGIDLTLDDTPHNIYQECQDENITVKYLINNAGMGYSGPFEDQELSFFDTLMKVNMLAMTKLTHFFINDMKKLSEAYILNISSMGGLFDMPFKVVYSASKAYVYGFSRALREELKDTSISVSVLCPGGVATNPKILEDVEKIGWAAKVITSMPDEVASYAVKTMLRKKAMGIPKLLPKIFAACRHVIPYQLQLNRIGYYLRKKYR